MNKTQYNLFRVKVIFPSQTELFIGKDATPQKIFSDCLNAQSSIKYRENHIWKAGNIHMINDDGGYFAFGKVSIADLETFDNDQQEFHKARYMAGLHSIIVFSLKYELLAIQVNHKLGLTEKTAEKFQAILRKVKQVSENNISIIVSKIRDPKDFIHKIRNAYAIKQLKATFTGPNPWDADKKFQKPSAEALKALNGDEGVTTFKGSNLNPEVVEAISRSTVSTGNNAKARILEKRNSHLKTVSMNGDPYSLIYDKKDVDPKIVYKDSTSSYESVRYGDIEE